MSITAEVVRQLREETGAGMMDCKAALVEATGDMVKAREVLRKKGLAAAAKKAGRVAAEGLVAVVAEGGRGAVVEVNSETDFVARNDTFQKFVAAVGAIALVTEGKEFPDNSLIVGAPARSIRKLDAAGIAMLKAAAEVYVRRFEQYRGKLERI